MTSFAAKHGESTQSSISISIQRRAACRPGHRHANLPTTPDLAAAREGTRPSGLSRKGGLLPRKRGGERGPPGGREKRDSRGKIAQCSPTMEAFTPAEIGERRRSKRNRLTEGEDHSGRRDLHSTHANPTQQRGGRDDGGVE